MEGYMLNSSSDNKNRVVFLLPKPAIRDGGIQSRAITRNRLARIELAQMLEAERILKEKYRDTISVQECIDIRRVSPTIKRSTNNSKSTIYVVGDNPTGGLAEAYKGMREYDIYIPNGLEDSLKGISKAYIDASAKVISNGRKTASQLYFFGLPDSQIKVAGINDTSSLEELIESISEILEVRDAQKKEIVEEER